MNRILKMLVESIPAEEKAIVSLWEEEKAKGKTSVQAAKIVADKFAYINESVEIDAIILRVYHTHKGKRIAVLQDGDIITGDADDEMPELKLKSARLKETRRKNILSGITERVYSLMGEIEEMNVEELIANASTNLDKDYALIIGEIQRIVGWGESSEWITPAGVHLRMNVRTTNGEWVTIFLRDWEQIVNLLPQELKEEVAGITDNEEIVEFVNGELSYNRDMRLPGASVIVSGLVKKDTYVNANGEERISIQLSLLPASILENMQVLYDSVEGGEKTAKPDMKGNAREFPRIEEIFKEDDTLTKFDFAVRYGKDADKALKHYLTMGAIYEKDVNTICIVR